LASWAILPANAYTQAAVYDFLSGADCQLVAYAHAHKHTVVTHEKAANPGAKKKIKIPDACDALNVPFVDTFKMLRDEQARFALAPKPTE
jgi:hypothetical protein